MPAIDLREATLTYGHRNGHADRKISVLSRFSIQVEDGEILAILGASGSGKSSLLRVFSGGEALASGTVHAWGGEARTAFRSGRIALASADAPLLPWRDVLANARLPLDLLGRPRKVSDAAARVHLKELRIDVLEHRRPSELSEGQVQRLRLAQALSTSPDLLLLDEPFNNADEGLRDVLSRYVARYIKQNDIRSAVFVTHFAFEAAAIADRIIVVGGPPLRLLHEENIPERFSERDLEGITKVTNALRPHLLRAASPLGAGLLL